MLQALGNNAWTNAVFFLYFFLFFYAIPINNYSLSAIATTTEENEENSEKTPLCPDDAVLIKCVGLEIKRLTAIFVNQ